MTDVEKKDDWMSTKWRPAMGWMYMMVCIFDFILFPILWAAVQFWENEAANDAFRQWNPLTLQGAGLFHMAMGAVLGVAAWSRGQEKMAGVSETSTDFQPSYQQRQYQQPEPQYSPPPQQYYQSSAVYTTRSGKVAPIIEEPEL